MINMIMLAVAFGIGGFWLGRLITQFPNEDEMFRRLIRIRTDRLVLKWDREDLKNRLEKAALEVAHKVSQS